MNENFQEINDLNEIIDRQKQEIATAKSVVGLTVGMFTTQKELAEKGQAAIVENRELRKEIERLKTVEKVHYNEAVKQSKRADKLEFKIASLESKLKDK